MDLSQHCPRCGDISSTPEICSECGSSMTPPVPTAISTPSPVGIPDTGSKDSCPACGENRPSLQDRYCGTCRYDYVLKKPFGETFDPTLPPPVITVMALEQDATPPVIVTSVGDKQPMHALSIPRNLMRWEAIAVADPSLCEPETGIPTDVRERVFPIDFPENLVGRRTGSTSVNPEISIADPGISKRHARVDRASDGSLTLIDLGSTNGTKLNGTPMEPNISCPLEDGDIILLGAYTRMTIKGR